MALALPLVLGRLQRRLRTKWLAASSDLSIAEVTVLSYLEQYGPATTSELATAEHMRPQSMAATVAALDSAALVTREASATDKRQVVVRISDEGRTRLLAVRHVHRAWLAEEIRTRLAAREQRQLRDAVDLLERLAQEPT